MLKIRLKRVGRIKKPFYKIVVMESLSKRDGKCIVDLGYYDPIKKVVRIEKEPLHSYLNFGAHPTNTVRHLILKMVDSFKCAYNLSFSELKLESFKINKEILSYE